MKTAHMKRPASGLCFTQPNTPVSQHQSSCCQIVVLTSTMTCMTACLQAEQALQWDQLLSRPHDSLTSTHSGNSVARCSHPITEQYSSHEMQRTLAVTKKTNKSNKQKYLILTR